MSKREYKFRGLTKAGKWLYGALLEYQNDTYIISSVSNDFSCCELYGVEVDDHAEVIPETVGQYIEEDENGNEIYDGDIVRVFSVYSGTETEHYNASIIEWNKDKALFVFRPLTSSWKFTFDGFDIYDHKRHIDQPHFEVIGNIHEHEKHKLGKEVREALGF